MPAEGGKKVALRDRRSVLLRLHREEDKEGLIAFYESLSPEALKWGLPPYDRQRIDSWLSDLPNRVMQVAVSGERIVGHV